MKSLALAALLAVGVVPYAQINPRPILRPHERREVIPWSEATGRPQINFGRAVGIYIWHEGNVVHVLSADDKSNGQVIHGTATLRGSGRVYDIDRIRDERQDKVGKNGKTVHFRLDTYTATDGFKFSIEGGTRLAFDIDQNGARDRNVYVGSGQLLANRGVVVFDLSR